MLLLLLWSQEPRFLMMPWISEWILEIINDSVTVSRPVYLPPSGICQALPPMIVWYAGRSVGYLPGGYGEAPTEAQTSYSFVYHFSQKTTPFVCLLLFTYLQWGTKVLRHFLKMAPFCIVDIPIPFPCLPQPLPPKINVVFWTLKSFFYFRQHWFGGTGVREFTAFN